MQLDIFTQSHGKENNAASESLYENNMVRLSRNTRVLLFAMLEGQKLTGLKCAEGVSNSATKQPVRMMEYRKRFFELKAAGVKLEEKIVEGKFKEWSIKEEDRLYYAIRFRGMEKC